MGFHFRNQKHLKRVFLNGPSTSDPYHRPDSPITAWAFIQEIRAGCVRSECFNSFGFFWTVTAFGLFCKKLHFVTKASNKNTKCLQMSCCTMKSRQLICCCCVSHIWDALSCARWQMGVYIKILVSTASKTRFHKTLSKTQCFNEDSILRNPDLDFVFHPLQNTVYCSFQFIFLIRNHLFTDASSSYAAICETNKIFLHL